jgi:hypothetical protein
MMRPALFRLGHDRRGGSAAEFALVLPLVGSMLLGALDLANGFSTRLRLEQAAQAGIEMVANRKGFAPDYSFALAEAQGRWGDPLISSSLQSWLECNGTRQPTGTTTCPSGQTRARYVAISLRAEYLPTLKLDRILPGDGPNGGYEIIGDAAVRVQ